MMNVPRWIRFAAGTIALVVTFNSACRGGSAAGNRVERVDGCRGCHAGAWRGGGAGLAPRPVTRLIMDGSLAVPRHYDELYHYYLDDYPPRYGGPIGYGRPDWEAYCYSRYRSFDPISGTYRGRDGRRHYCQ